MISTPQMRKQGFAMTMEPLHQTSEENRNESRSHVSRHEDYFDFLRKHHIDYPDELDIGFMVLDKQHMILTANSAVPRMLDCSMDDIIGANFTDFVYNQTSTAPPFLSKPFDIRLRNLHNFFWARIFAREAANPEHGDKEIHLTVRDVTAQKQTEKELGWQLKVSFELENIIELLARPQVDMEWITRRVLTAAANLTQSKDGFISRIQHYNMPFTEMVLTDVYPSRSRITRQHIRLDNLCEDNPLGLLGQSLSTLRPFFTSPPTGHPPTVSLPQGHIPISGFLSVPVLLDDHPHGMIVLANPKTTYSPEHVKVVQRLAELYIIAIRRHRNDADIPHLDQSSPSLIS